MGVMIELEQRTADALKAEADARGLSLDEFLQRLAAGVRGPAAHPAGTEAARDFDAALDELFADDPRKLPPHP